MSRLIAAAALCGSLCTVPAGAAQDSGPVPPALRLPPGARPTLYEVDLTVVPTRPRFDGELRVHLELQGRTALLWLNATGLTIEGATASGDGDAVAARVVPGGDDFVGFAFEPPLEAGRVVLAVRYTGTLDDVRSRGIYRVREPDGEWYAYTMFEPLDARRAMPCFDEPGYKVPWRLRLRVDRRHVALANTPVASEQDAGDGMKIVAFAETRPLPSYLVAFVVGPFDVVESGRVGRQGTPLRFVLPRDRAGELRYAREATPRVVELLEDYLGLPYPFEKLDVAVVPRYSGTMEHPGLVAMGQPLTLIQPSEETVSRRQDYANILIHELAHYWFGDLVTHAWWDDIWLNEALATWLDTKLTARLEPSWRYGDWSRRMTSWAMQTDALSTVRRIRQPVESRSDIESSFDGSTTYVKGAAVLAMVEGWVGEAAFRAGLRRYLSAHAWGNATAADLFAALAAESGRDVGASLGSFLDQAGLPLLSASLRCDARGPRLSIRQERFLAIAGKQIHRQTWKVPVCARWPAPEGAGRTCALVETAQHELPLGTRDCPPWVLLNEGALGYYRVAYDDSLRDVLMAEVGRGPGSLLTGPERVSLLDDVAALAGAGRLPLAAALDVVPSLVQDPDPFVTIAAVNMIGLLHPSRLPDALRPRLARALRALLGKRAASLGWAPGADPPEVRLLRERLVPLVATLGEDEALRAQARELALAWLADRGAVDADLAVGLLVAAAAAGDRSLYERVREQALGSKDRLDQVKLCFALGSFADPRLANDALSLILRTDIDIRESQAVLWAALQNRQARDAAWSFAREHFDAIAARLTGSEASGLLASLVSSSCDEARREEAAAFFGPRAARIDGGALALANALERADTCIAERRRDAAAVESFLLRY